MALPQGFGPRRSFADVQRQQLANQLLAQGGDASPVAHPMQGVARLAQALMGGYLTNRNETRENERQQAFSQAVTEAMQPQFVPGAAGAGPRPGASMAPPSFGTVAQRLAGNTETAHLAPQFQMMDLQQQAAEAAKRNDPMFGRVAVRGVGLVDMRGGQPQVVVPEQRQTAQSPLIQEFEAAKAAGFTGDIIAYQRLKADIGRTPERQARPMTPQERAQFGVPENVPAFIGGDGKPSVLNVPRETGTWAPDPSNPNIQIHSATGERKAIPGIEQETARRDQAASTVVDLDRMISSAQSLLTHPGRKAATGFSSMFNRVPGTDAYDFKAQLETLRAQVFLPEVQKMVGMGALSNAEGEKIAAAFAALDPGMSEAAFERSLRDALGRMQEARTRFEQRAGGTRQSQQGAPGAQAAPTVRTWNPATGRLE